MASKKKHTSKLSLIWLVYFLISILCSHLQSQTPVSGIISDAIWTKSNSPYEVIGNITVQSLTIEAGVEVLFMHNYEFNIIGRLTAVGTKQDSISFGPNLTNLLGWKGLYFKNGSSSSELAYCIVAYTSNFGVRFESAISRFENCSVVNSMASGIEIAASEINIHHCVIAENADHGIAITGHGSGVFSNCIIKDNTNNGIYADTGKIIIGNSLIHNNAQGGIFLLSAADTLNMTNCNVIYNPAVPGIFSSGGLLNIKNSIVYFNGSGIFSGGIQNITYSDIQGGNTQYNNINIDPQFDDTDYFKLSATSPCIDHGDTSAVYNDACFPPSFGSKRNDMGMYGGSGACGWYEPLYVSPLVLDFGNITLGDTVNLPVTIKNYSASLLPITLIQITGTDAPSFDLAPSSPFDILPFDSILIRITFFPKQAGSFSANLIIIAGQEIQSVSLTGSGVIPDIFVTPISLDFKEVDVGDSTWSSVRIFNVGPGELRINSLSSSNAAFSTRFHAFPVVIQTALVDTFQVRFRPDTSLTFTERIIINSNDPDETEFTVNLKGTGVAPILTIAQDSLQLGTVMIYGDSTLCVIFTNTGNDTLHIFSFEIFGPDSLSFSIIADPGEIYVSPSASDTISIQFHPFEVGVHLASLKIKSNDPFNNPQSVALQGWGVKPELLLSADSLNFGQVQVTSDSLISIVITNSGTALLEVTGIQIIPDSTAFTLITSEQGFALPPTGATDSIQVLFSPLTAGSFSAILQMISNDPDHDTVQIPLSGKGVNFEISVTPDDSLGFGKVLVYTDSILSLLFENRGSGDLSVEIKISGTDSSQFRCGTGDSSFLIPASSPVRQVEVIFNPDSRGSKNARLQIFSNDTNHPSIIINLSGTGVAAELYTVHNPVCFDSVYVWESQTESICLFNHGDRDLLMDSIRIGGLDSSDFVLLSGSPPLTIPVGNDSQVVQLQFLPQNPDDKNAYMRIFSNDPVSPSDIVLTARGLLDQTPARISVDTLTLDFTQGSSTPFHVILKDEESIIQSADLFFKPGGKKTYHQAALNKNTDSLWTTVIPSAQITERGLEYYLEVRHGGATTSYPRDGVTKPKIGIVQIPQLTNPQSTLSGKYQMISLPVHTGDQQLSELFQDELGLYDSTQYRFFNWAPDSSRYIELSAMDSSLPPAKALWLITRDSKVLKVEDAWSSLSGTAFPISLKQGWNMIAVPFAFPVSWTDMDVSGIQGNALWSYSGDSWNLDSILVPYRGYAVNAVTDTILYIPVQETDTLVLPKPVRSEEWDLQITAQKGGYRDFFNYAGVRLAARDEQDRCDISEPPVIGEFVSLYLEPAGSDVHPIRLAGDFRQPDHDVYTFNLKLTSNFLGLAKLTLLPHNLPDHYDWAILSTQSKIRYFKETLTTDLLQEDYQLVIGTKTALEPILQEYREIPIRFQLAQNFPNPFNPATTIVYQLPEATWLRIEIYDVLGRKIKSLLPYARQEPGYYQVSWDGRNDHNHPVASAVYILFLRSEKYQQAIKMVMQR